MQLLHAGVQPWRVDPHLGWGRRGIAGGLVCRVERGVEQLGPSQPLHRARIWTNIGYIGIETELELAVLSRPACLGETANAGPVASRGAGGNDARRNPSSGGPTRCRVLAHPPDPLGFCLSPPWVDFLRFQCKVGPEHTPKIGTMICVCPRLHLRY